MPFEPGTAPATPRYETLDMMRGLVIVFIVLLHAGLIFNQVGFNAARGLPRWLGLLLFGNGPNTVPALFAMSGFIITYTSIRRFGTLGRMRPALFYRLRFARIFPPLLLILVLLSGMDRLHVPGAALHPEEGTTLAGAVFAALTFHLNWYEAGHGYLPICWDVLWTLSVEELFYAVFPLVTARLLRFRAGLVLFVTLLLALVAMGPLARTVWAFNEVWQKKSYLGAMDSIALGTLAAMLAAYAAGGRRPSWVVLRGMQVVGGLLMLSMLAGPTWRWVKLYRAPLIGSGLDSTVFALGICLVMMAAVLHNRPGSRLLAPLAWYGRHSYEVYLTHEFAVIGLVFVYLHVGSGPLVGWTAAILVATALPGWMLARFYSEPMNRWLRRIG